MLAEYSPRPKTYAYVMHRLRAIAQHQAQIYLPVVALLATFVAVFSAVYELSELGRFACVGIAVACAGVVAGGVRCWSTPLTIRLGLHLDATEQSQTSIAAGYRLPVRPDLEAPFVVLGEVHPERIYRTSGEYTLTYQTSEKYSAAPEYAILPAQSLVTGLIVFGGIGTGKTAYVLRPALFKLFAHSTKPGGLVMDSKGALARPLLDEMTVIGRADDIRAIGPHLPVRWNPLHQPLSMPEKIAESLVVAIENMRGARYSAESGWIRDGAQQLAAGAIGYLRLVNDNYVTAKNVYDLLTQLMRATSNSDSPATNAEKLLTAISSHLPDDVLHSTEYKSYANLLINRMAEDEKYRTIYIAELSSLLVVLLTPRVVDLYNPPTASDIDFPSWTDCINEGRIAVLDCNSSEEPGLAVVLGMLLKLGFQSAILTRNKLHERGLCNAERYMCLLVDEYQDYASPSDADYLSLCREARGITCFLTQGWPSIVQRVGDERANVILQSLRNQLVLKQELPDRVAEIFGQFDAEEVDTNISEHVSDARFRAAGRFGGNSTVSQSLSRRATRKAVVQPEILKNLPVGQGILSTHDGHRALPVTRVFLIPYFARQGTRHADLEAARGGK